MSAVGALLSQFTFCADAQSPHSSVVCLTRASLSVSYAVSVFPGSTRARRTALEAWLSCLSSGSKLQRKGLLSFPPAYRCRQDVSVCNFEGDYEAAMVDGWIEDEKKSVSDFIRFRDNGEDELNLETATISYGKPFPFSLLQPNLQVDLVSAVHIADKDYFAALQEELGRYDRVLYEMVADKDPRQTNRNARTRWRPPRRLPGGRARKFSFFALIQRTMALLLKLDFQLECLDYRKENWYHADLDYQTFCSLQLARGESVLTVARDLALISMKTITRFNASIGNVDPWRARLLWASRALPMPLIGFFLIEGVCASPEAPFSRSPEMKALLDLDLSAAIKVILAKQITTDFTDDAALVVENSVIIGERNRVAMEELREAFQDGCKRIAIFYGGGHMPDMDRRLREEFGLIARKTRWQTAWSIKRKRRIHEGHVSSVLSSIAKVSGWPLDRYQTSSLLLFSWVLAIDLWFWEVLLDSLNNYCTGLIAFVVQFLDKAWGL